MKVILFEKVPNTMLSKFFSYEITFVCFYLFSFMSDTMLLFKDKKKKLKLKINEFLNKSKQKFNGRIYLSQSV